MTQYKTGRVSITHGSTSVVGYGTSWLTASITAGDIFTVKGEPNIYWIDSVDDNISITLSQNYYSLTGSNLHNAEYAIVQDYTTNYTWPKIANSDYNWTHIIRNAILSIEKDMAAGLRKTVTFDSPSQGVSGSYYPGAPSGGVAVTYYLPDTSIPAEEGVLYYDSHKNYMIYLASGMASGGDTSGSDYLPTWVPNWRKFITNDE